MTNITVKVSKIEQLCSSIKMFEFQAEKDQLLPFKAGSHIRVHLNNINGYRAYSLISDPNNINHYKIAVLHDENSKGGSSYMHTQLTEGDIIEISPAENFFPLVNDANTQHILIAGGIGITPFISYIYELEKNNFPFELHYSFRNGNNAAFIELLKERLSDKLYLYDNSQDQKLSVESLIQQQIQNAHIYVCGPQSLIDAVIEHGSSHLGSDNVHFENFTETGSSGDSFEVVFQRSGFSLNIDANTSILQAIEADKRIKVECMCRNGICGTCETTILEGEADHRDLYLDDAERAAQETMMICVSRAKGKKIVLDL